MTEPKRRTGRPTDASLDDPAVVDELCARIAAGQGIMTVCKARDMPSHATVWRRMYSDESFARRIARAREAQQDAMAEEVISICDAATPQDWQVARLRAWARTWAAAKLAPKKYGLTTKHEHGGSQGGEPIPLRIESLSDHQIDALVLRLTQRVGDEEEAALRADPEPDDEA